MFFFFFGSGGQRSGVLTVKATKMNEESSPWQLKFEANLANIFKTSSPAEDAQRGVRA